MLGLVHHSRLLNLNTISLVKLYLTHHLVYHQELRGDATDVFVEARRVLGNVLRTRTTSWSRGVVP